MENSAGSPASDSNRTRRTGRTVALGCAAGCLVVVVVLVAVVWNIRRKAVEEWRTNPELREATGKEILGAERLPEGYYTIETASIPAPLEFDFVELADEPLKVDRGGLAAGERQFVYIKYSEFGRSEREIRAFFEGRADQAVAYADRVEQEIDFERAISRGSFVTSPHTVTYVAGYGTFWERGNLLTLMLIDCPFDRKMRSAIWRGPGPDAQSAAPETAFAGTVADESAIRAFMAHFSLCEGAGPA